MSGSYEDHEGNAIEGEFHQIKKSGLILNKNQFHAIDINPYIVERNKYHYPDLNWYCGDFLQIMKDYFLNNYFNPQIINYDNVRLPEKGATYLASLLMFLENNIDGDLMVVSNLMLNHPYQKSLILEGQKIIDILFYFHDFNENWEVVPYCYKYHGSGTKAKTWMASIIFIKKIRR